MEKTKARLLIERHSLISRKNSKQLLYHIRNNKKFDENIAQFVTKDKFDLLKLKYKEKLTFLENKKINIDFKNLPFLYMIKDLYPQFKWEINKPSKLSNNKTDLIIYTSNVESLNPSLSSLILKLVDKRFDNNLGLSNQDKNVKSLITNLYNKVNFVTSIHDIKQPLITCLENAFKKGELNILSPLCPDYAHIDLGKGFFRFTFDGLGEDIGLTSKRLLENLNALHSTFQENNIKVNHIAAIGDFEALSDENCKRVNLSKEAFIEKLILSQRKLKKVSGKKLETILFSDICGGLKKWEKIHKKFFEMLINNNFGSSDLSFSKIKKISNARKPLLKRWFGDITEKQILKFVLWQGAEYATMGYIIKKKFENPVIIGADHYKMAPFYSLASDLPVLYLTSNYIRN